jgi:hypothetical protein
VSVVAEFTISEKILLAAYDLEEQGQSPFSAEALIVATWQKFPRSFGLKGYADQYPDSNKVLTSIMGEKGLARREGRQAVRRMRPDDVAPPVEKKPAAPRLSRDHEKFLQGLLASAALEKYQLGLKTELTFGDACKFWGITDNMRGEALDGRLTRLRATLTEIDEAVPPGGIDLSSGRSIAVEDLRLVRKVDEYLTDRFGRHLALLRNRGERN